MLNQENLQKLVNLKHSNPVAWKKIEGYCITNIVKNDEVLYGDAEYPADYPSRYKWNTGLLEQIEQIVAEYGIYDIVDTYSAKSYASFMNFMKMHSDKIKFIFA